MSQRDLYQPEIGDLVKIISTGVTGIVLETDLRREHQYLEREVFLRLLIDKNVKRGWTRSADCTLIQSGVK